MASNEDRQPLLSPCYRRVLQVVDRMGRQLEPPDELSTAGRSALLYLATGYDHLLVAVDQ